jgi:probable HAF family extracellular repeat protein
MLDADAYAGNSFVTFQIPGTGMHTISPTSPLLVMKQPAFIDGFSETGYAGTPLIEINGDNAGVGADGLILTGGNSTVRGLVINGFSGAGIHLEGEGGDIITADYLGTDSTGRQAEANGSGVLIDAVSNNTIGGANVGTGNLISGNYLAGVAISGSGNLVAGNHIGTDVSGTTPLPNLTGVAIFSNGAANTVGGTTSGARNLVSGNRLNGVLISGSGNVVEGNQIGTDVTGAIAVPNTAGVVVLGSNNTLGGSASGVGNIISGNRLEGVTISGSGNVVEGNRIGTNATGTTALANTTGIFLLGSNNTLGGTGSGAGNLIAGNRLDGVTISGSGNVVEGNRIGTDVTGAAALPNQTGVRMIGRVSDNTIGGSSAGAGNLISGNRNDGVGIDGGTGTFVQGNWIGTNAAGTSAVPNRYGIEMFSGSSASVVGGMVSGAGNVISGNSLDGIGVYSDGNAVQGNFIGTDMAGTLALGNGRDGVSIRAWEHGFSNTIGGTATGAANVIAHNGRDGVLVDRGTGNAIHQNSIFANGRLGIELRHGGNQNQPAPVVTTAFWNGLLTTVMGSLSGAADTAFTVELFASPDDAAGEGRHFVRSLTVATDADGHASFTTTVVTSNLSLGQFATATATDPVGNTSDFSASVAVTGPGFTTLDVPGAASTGAGGINNSGQVVGSYSDTSGNGHGFLWSGSVYTTLDVPGAMTTGAAGINDLGQIVGSYQNADGWNHGFLFSGGIYTTLDVPGAVESGAGGINDVGQIVGWYRDAENNFHGFFLSGDVYTTLDDPEAYSTYALGINDSGQIVGWWQDGAPNHYGFLLSGGVYATLNVPGAANTAAFGINNAGQIVGSYSNDINSGPSHGFLLSEGVYTPLDALGATSTGAGGINDAGQIVGSFDDANGTHGFFAIEPPSVPGSGSDLLSSLTNQTLVRIGEEAAGSPDTFGSGMAPKDQGAGLSRAVVAEVGQASAYRSTPSTANESGLFREDMASIDDFFAISTQDELFGLFA